MASRRQKKRRLVFSKSFALALAVYPTNMLNPKAKLIAEPFSEKVAKAPTRDGFGKGTVEAGKANKNVVVFCADLKESTRAEWFEKEFPERFVVMGVAGQAMATVAGGMAAVGKVPFIASYACFSPGRNYEQIRTTIALNDVPVKVCGMHAGVSVGPDGATHQMLEDIALMRTLPNMIVINPADSEEGRKATLAAAENGRPTYLRFGRAAMPKITIFSTGSVTYNALCAARALDAEGVGVLLVHLSTIKPLDVEAVLGAARKTGRVVTVEEHQISGGFGSALAELLSEHYPVLIKRLGINDQFGQSGDPDELLEHYGLGASSIRHAAEQLLAV